MLGTVAPDATATVAAAVSMFCSTVGGIACSTSSLDVDPFDSSWSADSPTSLCAGPQLNDFRGAVDLDGMDFLRYDREVNDVRGVRFSFPSGFLDILLGGGANATLGSEMVLMASVKTVLSDSGGNVKSFF